MHANPFVLACDIGGTHITCAVVDLRNWTIQDQTICRQPVNSASDAKSIFHSWTTAMQQAIDSFPQPIQHIGIAMPGPFDYEQGRALMTGQTKYDSLYRMDVTPPIVDGLHSPIEKICYINDAAAFLQGEVFARHLHDQPRILGITLGTGLGSAVWTQGQQAFDAALWNTPYKDRIFEEYLATRWFVGRFKELSGIHEKGLKEILENHANHPATFTLLDEYIVHLSDFMAYFSGKYQSNSYIIGGNITKAWERIFARAQSRLATYRIELGQYGEFAAIMGAASLYYEP